MSVTGQKNAYRKFRDFEMKIDQYEDIPVFHQNKPEIVHEIYPKSSNTSINSNEILQHEYNDEDGNSYNESNSNHYVDHMENELADENSNRINNNDNSHDFLSESTSAKYITEIDGITVPKSTERSRPILPSESDNLADIRLKSYDQINPFEAYSYRIHKNGKPPKSENVIRILKSDVRDTNNRVHELLIRLRMSLAMKAGIPCSVVDHSLHEFSDSTHANSPTASSTRDLLSSASQVVTQLRQHSNRFVSAMAISFRPGDCERTYLGFLAIHRLFHPFSVDNIHTTKLLRTALKYQIQESTNMLELYSHVDSKIVISRTIFISDPNTALAWNPLAQPMPVMPNVSNEPVLTTLLRIYSIRRDVSSFMRVVWRQAIPSIVAIIEPRDYEDISSHSFKNLLSVANRILGCVLEEKIAELFPPSALVMCQELFDVGGHDAIHAYILNFIILPSIIKLLRGDHESIENEQVHDKYSVNDLLNQYYNLDIWWPTEGFESIPFNPVNTLIWLVWRLYTGATLLQTSVLEILTCDGFFAGGPIMDLSRVADQKIRNILVRLQHKNDHFCRVLLQQNVSQYSDVSSGKVSREAYKPPELLMHTLMSKEELSWLSRDILNEIELYTSQFHTNDESNDELISLGLLLKRHIEIDENFNSGASSAGEDLLLMSYKRQSFCDDIFDHDYDDYDVNTANEKKHTKDMISIQYNRLVRALVTGNRYEDSLIRMIYAVSNSINTSGSTIVMPGGMSSLIDLKDLMQDKSWYIAPECDADFKVKDVELYDRHTTSFQSKTKDIHHGFDSSSLIEINNQDAVAMVNDLEHKTRSELVNEIPKTLRFGTSSQAVAVGTSIARPKHRLSRPIPTAVNKELDQYVSGIIGSKSKYTKSSIHPASSLLVRTEASQNQYKQRVNRRNRFDDDRDFMMSMRGHSVIPTDAFLSKRQSIANSRRHTNRSDQNIDYMPTSSSSAISMATAPKPFPAHLRNRIRQENEYSSSEYKNGMDQPQSADPLNLAQSIIQDYNNLFSMSSSKSMPNKISNQQRYEDSRSITPTSDTSPHRRRKVKQSDKSRNIPEQLPQMFNESSYLAPTQALLNRYALSKELIQELQYDSEASSKVHGRAVFKPSGNNIVPPTGGRVPKYWNNPSDDGYDDDDASSTGRRSSRSQSRQSDRRRRSRSNSVDSSSSSQNRSSSRQRIRSPSYHVRKDPLPEEARGNLPSRESTPNSKVSHGYFNDMNRQDQYREQDISQNYTYNENPMNGYTRAEYNQPSTEFVEVSRIRPNRRVMPQTTDVDESNIPNNIRNQEDVVSNYNDRNVRESQLVVPSAMLSTMRPTDSNSLKVNAAVSNKEELPTYELRSKERIPQPPILPPPKPIRQSSSFRSNVSVDVPISEPHIQKTMEEESNPARQQPQQQYEFDGLAHSNNFPSSEIDEHYEIPAILNNREKTNPNPSTNTTSQVDVPKVAVIQVRKRNWTNGDLRQFLVTGIRVIKHGRNGFPKSKFLQYDDESKQIVWRSNALTSVFSYSVSSILIRDITQVLRGIHTDVLSKSKQLDPSCCLSIITKDRSLDLVFDSTLIRDKVFRSLERIMQTEMSEINVKYV